ncbi:MAG: hypothetical protein KDA45_01665, partial [Planctomycetales bacterium]|nr:hypothetical protein [Planctomycetales bacterium]
MLHTTRRKFAFYLGMGLFSLGERLNARALDDWAAATMQAAPLSEPQTPEDEGREHWTPAENSSWTWFERENLVDGQWCLTGITTPVNKHSAEVYYGSGEYLSESLVPDAVRAALRGTAASESRYEEDGDEEGQPSAERRA